MKRYIPIMAIVLVPMLAVPGHCFLDYFFGGSSTSDAVGNNVVGDLRAWWTGNPVYNFNPYYSGSNPLGQQPNQAMQGGQPMNPTASPQYYPQQNQQPSVTYYPPHGQQQYYDQGQPMQQYPQQMPPQAYQQQAPQQGYYQGPQQQYPPQAAYQQEMPQYYQGGQPGGGRFQNYQYEQETPQPD